MLPALTGDVTTSAGACATTLAKTATSILDGIGSTQGNVLYRGSASWSVLAPGTNGQALRTGGAGVNPSFASDPISMCGGSGSVSNGAGATDFLGIANLSTTEAAVQFPAPLGGTVTAIYVSSSVAPGGSKTFTYTVDKAASAQSVTCQSSGASATTCNDTAHSFTFNAGDLLSVKLVTSASSNTGVHSYCLKVTTP